MAKSSVVKTRMKSTGENSGYCYYTKKNTKKNTEKWIFRKYDPILRKHVEFKETKLK